MAEITTAAAGKTRAGGRRGKKLSTRVDLTPMVDLGFLLITFFIFTTTMATPSVMPLHMPAEGGEPMPIKESGSLTLVPFSSDRIFYYHGILEQALASGNYGITGYSYADGVGDIIRRKKISMEKHQPSSAKNMMVIVKPMNTSNYRNVVDILDEMKINLVSSYALTDLTNVEEEIIRAKGIR